MDGGRRLPQWSSLGRKKECFLVTKMTSACSGRAASETGETSNLAIPEGPGAAAIEQTGSAR